MGQMYSISLKIHSFWWFLNIFVNNIVKNHLRHPAVPPGGRGDGPSGRGAPSDSEFSNISKISQNLTFRLIRTIKLSTYNAIASPLDDRQITFSDSIHLIIEAMAPGNDIFHETGEIPVVWESLERLCKNVEVVVRPVTRSQWSSFGIHPANHMP